MPADRAWVRALCLAAGALAALGSSRSTPPPRERLIDEDAERRARPRPGKDATQTPAAGLPYPACPGSPGRIRRAHLATILTRGPGVFLGGLSVTAVRASALPEAAHRAWPALAEARGTGHGFGGWRLGRFHPGDPCLGRADLQPGDVLVSVNGNALRRPGDLVSLWAGLRSAPHLVVRLIRQGEPMTFVVQVEGDPPRGGPRP